jgi:hypothetical protein
MRRPDRQEPTRPTSQTDAIGGIGMSNRHISPHIAELRIRHPWCVTTHREKQRDYQIPLQGLPAHRRPAIAAIKERRTGRAGCKSSSG